MTNFIFAPLSYLWCNEATWLQRRRQGCNPLLFYVVLSWWRNFTSYNCNRPTCDNNPNVDSRVRHEAKEENCGNVVWGIQMSRQNRKSRMDLIQRTSYWSEIWHCALHLFLILINKPSCYGDLWVSGCMAPPILNLALQCIPFLVTLGWKEKRRKQWSGMGSVECPVYSHAFRQISVRSRGTQSNV
jgi:hypothetical protein